MTTEDCSEAETRLLDDLVTNIAPDTDMEGRPCKEDYELVGDFASPFEIRAFRVYTNGWAGTLRAETIDDVVATIDVIEVQAVARLGGMLGWFKPKSIDYGGLRFSHDSFTMADVVIETYNKEIKIEHSPTMEVVVRTQAGWFYLGSGNEAPPPVSFK